MARHFKVQLIDVTFTNNDDATNFLEGTDITEIGFEGNNKLKSLDSFAKDCVELLTITPGIDFANIQDFDKILYNTPNLKSVILKNVTSKGISLEDAFPFTLEYIAFSGDYNKEALQNIIDIFDWTFEEFGYLDKVLENIMDIEVILKNDNKLSTFNTLEKKARYLELQGDSINNRSKDSNKTYELVDYATMPMKDGIVTPNTNKSSSMLIQTIEGNTYNNLLGNDGRGSRILTSEGVIFENLPIQTSSTYCIVFECYQKDFNISIELNARTYTHKTVMGNNLVYIKTNNAITNTRLMFSSNDNVVIGHIMLIEDSKVPENIAFIEDSQSIGMQEGSNYVLTIDLFNDDWDNL